MPVEEFRQIDHKSCFGNTNDTGDNTNESQLSNPHSLYCEIYMHMI